MAASTSDEPELITVADLGSGATITFDAVQQTIECALSGVCIIDCALNTFCESLKQQTSWQSCGNILLASDVALCFSAGPATVGIACAPLLKDFTDALKCALVTAGSCLASCVVNGCPHDVCSVGDPLATACNTCSSKVCACDSYCCTTQWDQVCVNEAVGLCGQSCTVTTGHCQPQCNCPPPGCAHDECSTGSALVSSCSSCAATVCACDHYCCLTQWDDHCVAEAQQKCGKDCRSTAQCSPSCSCELPPCTPTFIPPGPISFASAPVGNCTVDRGLSITNPSGCPTLTGTATIPPPFYISAGGIINVPPGSGKSISVRHCPDEVGPISSNVIIHTDQVGNFTRPVSGFGCLVTPVAPGSSISGTITVDDCPAPEASNKRADIYSFQATKGQVVTLRMTSSAFVTYVCLRNGQYGTLACRAGNFTYQTAALPYTGLYEIEATSNLSGGTGPYQLTVSLSGP
jgi:hypothetical protein